MTKDAKLISHTPGSIVSAARDTLQQYGLADLSMRRLAGQLGIQPSALYWHFANKQELLAALADDIVASGPGSASGQGGQGGQGGPGGHGADAGQSVQDFVLSWREYLLKLRDAAELLSSSYALGLGGMQLPEVIEQALTSGGVAPAKVSAGQGVIVHFLLGAVQHEQQHRQAAELGIITGEHPERWREDFMAGLEVILRGLEYDKLSQKRV